MHKVAFLALLKLWDLGDLWNLLPWPPLPPSLSFLSLSFANDALEREFILRALEQTDGNRTHAARLLDLSHRALLYKIKDFGLS